MVLVAKLHIRRRLCDCCSTLKTSSAARLFRTQHGPLRNEAAFSDVALSKPTTKKVTATKTRKKFTDLPKTWLNPDGTPAAPLGPWLGGLEPQPSSEAEPIASPFLAAGNSLLATADEGPGSGVEDSSPDLVDSTSIPKRRTRKKKDTAVTKEDGVSVEQLEPEGAEVALPRPKKSRKKKDASVAEESKQLEIENPKATEPKPKKSRKKLKATPTENTIELDDLAVPEQPMTPLAKEVLDNLAKFPHCILLTRVGQFYESYFNQAAEVARLLNIKLTSKRWGGERVPMCGFPLMHLNKYLKVLVQDNNRFVAMCEEFMKSRVLGPKAGFDRRVTRIVTPGTLIDEPFLTQYENNYLLSIHAPPAACGAGDTELENSVGLAWIDVSTGEFFAKSTATSLLRDELVRIRPKEVVLEESIFRDPSHPVRQIATEERFFISHCLPPAQSQNNVLFAEHVGSDDLTSQMEPQAPAFNIVLTEEESKAVQLLTVFLHANLLEHMPRLPSPSKEATAGRMQIDAHTIKSLEIRETIREGGTAGSLLSTIKRTVTNGGTRLLTRWISSPSVSLKEIKSRQSLVAFFYARPHLREDLSVMLSGLEDSTRIVQKLLLGRGDHTDLTAISASVRVWTSMKRRLELEKKMEAQEKGPLNEDHWASLDILMEKLHDLQGLSQRIQAALSRSGTASQMPSTDAPSPEDQEADADAEPEEEAFPAVPNFKPNYVTSFNWVVRPEFSEQLMALHKALSDCLDRREQLEQHLQAEYNAPSLTLRSSPGFGMHVHIAKAKRDLVKVRADSSFIPISESASTSSFFLQEWSQLGAQIVRITSAIQVAEREAFELLREEVNEHESNIRRNARITDELDVTVAFANLAHEMQFVQPVLHEDKSYHIVNGRHPTVELGLLASGRTFVPNTVTFTSDGPMHIITGPNMAGKSTLLRQTALISILAQTGSFVPADTVEIGIVDAIFSRVGANDDLFRNRSTFMVEMMETADILKRATPNSLVIMDEVGRGTSVQDGLAIAFATIHHLITVNKSRAMFATHFHELADMLGCSDGERGQGIFEGVKFFYTDVDETEDGYFAYSHRLKPGVNRDSHGLKVAQLAGMPESAVNVARAALSSFRDSTTGLLTRDHSKLRTLGQTLTQT